MDTSSSPSYHALLGIKFNPQNGKKYLQRFCSSHTNKKKDQQKGNKDRRVREGQ